MPFTPGKASHCPSVGGSIQHDPAYSSLPVRADEGCKGIKNLLS